MDFGSASYGINKVGVENYITSLNSIILSKVAPTIIATNDVKSAVDTSWKGKSAEDFKTSLDKGASDLSETLGQLQQVFETEMSNIMDSIADMDNNLFNE